MVNFLAAESFNNNFDRRLKIMHGFDRINEELFPVAVESK